MGAGNFTAWNLIPRYQELLNPPVRRPEHHRPRTYLPRSERHARHLHPPRSLVLATRTSATGPTSSGHPERSEGSAFIPSACYHPPMQSPADVVIIGELLHVPLRAREISAP